MKKYISIILTSLLMCSCVDTVILPDDKTVDEDFWQTKSDVSLMVNGAYKSMLNNELLLRLVVWGDFRSDELVNVTSIKTTAYTTGLTEIGAANIQTTNTYSNWATLYSVINNCNIVLEKAGAVRDIDPSYTDGDYLSDRSQMLALRSLCYFYLVRAFRDVPYSTVAYMNSSQEMNLPQTPPDVVLQNCINDLVEAETNALDPAAYTDWRRTGWINRDGIRAILADIYLWRASVMHSASDYQMSSDYCDQIIASKKAQHIQDPNEIELKEYPLADGTDAFGDLFITQNAEESIFELQFNGTNNGNAGLCSAIYKWDTEHNSQIGYMQASPIYGTLAAGNVYEKQGDYRFLENTYGVGSDAASYDVRKMVETMRWFIGNPVGHTSQTRPGSRSYERYAQNYIIYRLSDIMLMKAEAMTQLAADNTDSQLRNAFRLVQYVNNRSIYEGNLNNDSLRWSQNNTKEAMETLVLKERLRELSFEGKRWYDLLRYNYRHVEGIDYTKILADQEAEGKAFVNNYTDMMSLMTRKYTSGGASVSSKMRTEPYLYMPVLQSQMKINPLLKQNPAYEEGKEFEKQ